MFIEAQTIPFDNRDYAIIAYLPGICVALFACSPDIPACADMLV